MSNWFQPSKPAEKITARPWLSDEAWKYFRSILQPYHGRVLEHGAGGSTLWLSSLVTEVISVEDDPDWLTALSKQVGKNVTLILSKNGHIPAISGKFDILFIDGEPVENRALYLKAARELVVSGGWIVLDNANRPEYKAEREALKEFADLTETFDGNQQAGFLYLVTEFWKVR